MSNQRGGIDIEVQKAEGDKISGTMALAGGCGGSYDFSADVAPGGAVSFGAKMRQPCGRVTVKLHWADGDKQALVGSFKSDLDGGEIKLARDD
ncbi:MAG: hypothetical protein O3A96_13435 [Proteobacteria bacterium]|nr:hypothetical protein [Pseudomonadota bacterium]